MTLVLDHGFVLLVDHMGDDSSIVRSARVSTGQGTKTPAEDAKLIRYLHKNQHMTPFEHVTFTFHVKAPIFVTRQWQRHRAGSFNEISARYTEISDDFYIPDMEQIRQQGKTNRQGSGKPLPTQDADRANTLIDCAYDVAYGAYKEMLDLGVARETARIVLPVGVYTEFFWTVNLRNLMHFLDLRLDHHAQFEIREYAEVIAQMVMDICPVAYDCFMGEVDK